MCDVHTPMNFFRKLKKEYRYSALAGGILIVLLAIGIIVHFSPSSPTPTTTVPTQFAAGTEEPASPTTPLLHYIEIENSCNWAFEGSCVNVRSSPGTNYPSVLRLRDGEVYQVSDTTTDADGQLWYKIVFESDVRYPERITSNWYVAAVPGSVMEFDDPGEVDLQPGAAPVTDKRIVVNLTDETLTAYDGNTVFMTETISRGVDTNPSPVGTFERYKKTPSRYMQGPLPGETDEYYDLPGTPWDMYFSPDGAVLHGAYWHNDFGTPKSHGCVNQTPENAKKLYARAPVGTPVIVNP